MPLSSLGLAWPAWLFLLISFGAIAIACEIDAHGDGIVKTHGQEILEMHYDNKGHNISGDDFEDN